MTLDINPNNLHHAHLIESSIEEGLIAVRSFLQERLSMEIAGNPDVMNMKEDRLGIDAARELRSAQQRKGISQKRKIFLVGFSQATAEAQNALLKSLEEPTDNTHFFIVTPNTGALLPTLLSRVEIISLASDADTDDNADSLARDFLAATPPERISLVEDIVNQKDATRAGQLLDALERQLHHDLDSFSGGYLQEILHAQKYISNAGASIKQILHHLALALPSVESNSRTSSS